MFALLFVSAFGLGPLAGILAIAVHTFGALGKLFTEVVENIDLNPVAKAGGPELLSPQRSTKALSNVQDRAIVRQLPPHS